MMDDEPYWPSIEERCAEPLSTSLTQEWLDCFNESVKDGENLAKSGFWRLAVYCLPLGVNGNDPRVKAAIAKIKEAVEKSDE